ncbi:hypothetical protein L596_030541 [Steinernema carpocapsae]|uniref:Uncharacterized protein n=1 Tax=Steinernema carpocapsae TaxID=34508 RepID=A0A4U5LPR1_STECR|nr:hypothetical protein L596_030541 [Steinernema carpocapsae]
MESVSTVFERTSCDRNWFAEKAIVATFQWHFLWVFVGDRWTVSNKAIDLVITIGYAWVAIPNVVHYQKTLQKRKTQFFQLLKCCEHNLNLNILAYALLPTVI